ncbi:methylaspartate mutase [Streptomyces sp. NBC_00829]|uniref:methylaspartate mutase n=1 Tax=Streptomyces sp. NBC_00829 TaxID=2903679 RepID=UPI002F911A6F|nr:methylaspartate mutase [Streptomyces sp. NBC_00829]
MSSIQPAPRSAGFGRFVSGAQAGGQLVVQPRMGMPMPEEMRGGLLATKRASATTVGTITLDSYTRVGDHQAARAALRRCTPLNGYPILAHAPGTTRAMLAGIMDATFPVQVRHGSADPRDILAALEATGIDATEGGPVSYCLPYSRMPLRESIRAWSEGSRRLAQFQETGRQPHVETFGGCMLGQLCPPSLLVAISLLEALFFRQHGLGSISMSYAQQTNAEQDEEAISALHNLAAALLPDVDWHVVVYAYMGVYPRTHRGAELLLQEAARLAVRTGSARLIVKTAAEAHRIPTISENVAALETAARAAQNEQVSRPVQTAAHAVHAEAREIVHAVLSLHQDIGCALAIAFERGYLDIPYCLHPDNAGRTRSYIDVKGRLQWSTTASLPINGAPRYRADQGLTASGLLSALSYVAEKFDKHPHDNPSSHLPRLERQA